jgi:hypothetical protein
MPPPPPLKLRAAEVSVPCSLSCDSRPSRMHFFKATHTCLHTAGAGDEEAAAAAAAAIGQAAAQAGVMPEQGVLRVENGFPIVSPEAGVLACVCAFVRACFFSQPRVLSCVCARACVVKASCPVFCGLLVQSTRCLASLRGFRLAKAREFCRKAKERECSTLTPPCLRQSPPHTHHMHDMETGARAAELGDAAAAVPNPSQTRAAGLSLNPPPPCPLFRNCATRSSAHTRRLTSPGDDWPGDDWRVADEASD